MFDGKRLILWLRKSLKWIIPIIIIAGVAGYIRFRPIRAERYTVYEGVIEREVTGTGTLEARTSVTVSSRITGRIISISVDQNDIVSKDKILVTLDDSELKSQVAMAEAVLEEHRSASKRAQSDVTRTEAVLVQAQKDFDRVQALVERNVSPPVELEKAQERLDVTRAENQRASLVVVEMENRILSAEQTLEYHKSRLDDAKILWAYDTDGVVVYRHREPGEVVVPGTPILDIVSLDELWISAWVDESAMNEISGKQPARVVFRSEPRKSYSGSVLRVAKQVDRETREFVVDVLLEELPENWAIGQRAEVYILTSVKHDALVVPMRYLSYREGKAGVILVHKGNTQWQEVEIGLRGNGNVEVIEGISAGDEIVDPSIGEYKRISK